MGTDIHGWAQMKANLDPRLDEMTSVIIGAAFTVSNELGHGFLETVYKNALMEELAAQFLSVKKEQSYPVSYRGKQIGQYIADIVVENCVIVELKAVEDLAQTHRAQLLNYLKASRLPIGLLFNFGRPKIQVRRVIL